MALGRKQKPNPSKQNDFAKWSILQFILKTFPVEIIKSVRVDVESFHKSDSIKGKD